MCYFFNNVRPLLECYYYVRTSVLSTPFAHALLLRSCAALSVSWASPPVYHKARILSSIFFYFFYTLCVAHYGHFVKPFRKKSCTNFFSIFCGIFCVYSAKRESGPATYAAGPMWHVVLPCCWMYSVAYQ